MHSVLCLFLPVTLNEIVVAIHTVSESESVVEEIKEIILSEI